MPEIVSDTKYDIRYMLDSVPSFLARNGGHTAIRSGIRVLGIRGEDRAGVSQSTD